MIDIVMGCPERVQSRDGDEHSSVGIEQTAGVFECCCGIRKMFQHIEHEDQVECLLRLKRSVERLTVNLAAPQTVWCERCFVGFDAKHLAESSEPGKKQTVSTADIQNIRFTICAKSQALNLSQNGSLPCPPPPVLLIQIPVQLCVVALHLSACHSKAKAVMCLRNIRCDPRGTVVAA